METITGRSVFSGKPITIGFQDGKIRALDKAEESPELDFISPGFFDIQVNGFMGTDYSLRNLQGSQIKALVEKLGMAGTSRHLATFVTMDENILLENLSLCAELMEKDPLVGACIAGFHLEGPFISAEDGPRGAHNKKFTALPDFARFKKWQEAARGNIKLVTLAPELPGAIPFIEEAAASGVKVALGHLSAGAEQIESAIAAGACLSTHLGNGSHAMIPRLKNYIWEQMACENLAASIICDGFHLPKAVVKVMLKAKGPANLILISDAALLGGYKRGLYTWNEQDVEVADNGRLVVAGTEFLAGAGHLLDWDIARFMEFSGSSLGQAISLCTENPARILGFDSVTSEGSPPEADFTGFSEGSRADLTVFAYAPGDEKLRVKKTFSAGLAVF